MFIIKNPLRYDKLEMSGMIRWHGYISLRVVKLERSLVTSIREKTKVM